MSIVHKCERGGEVRRRDVLAGMMAATASSLLPAALLAQDFPSRPIKIIVPFPASGGILDTMARLIADELREASGQPGVVENRTGAGGLVGAQSVFEASPDGYTILCASGFLFSVGHLLFAGRTFDPRQFDPISAVAQYPSVLVVRPDLPVNSTTELIAYAKAHPGKLSFGSQGIGTVGHLVIEQIKQIAGIDLLHVPFRGSGQAISALLGAQIDVSVEILLNVRPLVDAGKLKLIGVGSTTRLKDFPNVPMIAETLTGFDGLSWVGLAAPPGTPTDVTLKLAGVARQALARPAIRTRLESLELELLGTTADEMREKIRRTEERWAPVITTAGIQVK